MKFYGAVGFIKNELTSPGIYSSVVTRINYKGTITMMHTKRESGETLSDDVSISNMISIIADPYAYENFFAVKYVEWQGVKWNVKSIDVQPPRLVLTIGGVYNGE